jgi:UrcA family protein
VESPYTIRQQVLNRPMLREMQQTRISVDQQVSFADLDFSKPGEITRMRERIRDAARDSCQELDRRFPRSRFVPVNELNRQTCVRQAISQGFAQLDEVLMPSVR